MEIPLSRSSCPLFVLAGLWLICANTGSANLQKEENEPTITRLYVSSEYGDDTWSGLLAYPNKEQTDGPLKSIEQAREVAKTWKIRRVDVPVTVFLRQGVYLQLAPVIFRPEDSGSPSAPITYTSFPGEKAVITGGVVVDWRVKEGIWVAELGSAGVQSKDVRQLFMNGVRRQRARSPNTGFFLVNGEMKKYPTGHFYYFGSDLHPQLLRGGKTEIVALQAWADCRLFASSLDTEEKIVWLSSSLSPYLREISPRYWIENHESLLDTAGEWYAHQDGVLRYIPFEDETPARVKTVVTINHELFVLKGDLSRNRPVHSLRFLNLEFAYSNWAIPDSGYVDNQAAARVQGAFYASGAVGIEIDSCRFVHLGGYAVEFSKGCRGNIISNNDMYDLGGGGIKLGNTDPPLGQVEIIAANKIIGNSVSSIGKIFPAAVGILAFHTEETVIASNRIRDTYYTGISVGWTWGYGPSFSRNNTIEKNCLYNIGQGFLSDLAGIYTLGVQPGTVIRSNRVEKVEAWKYGGNGIYLDEGSSFIKVEGNLVSDCSTCTFYLHYGRDNVVENNVFMHGGIGQIHKNRKEKHHSLDFQRNIVVWKYGALLMGEWGGNGYSFDHNIYDYMGGEYPQFARWDMTEWKARGQDRHSLLVHSRLFEQNQKAITFEEESPARKLGIQDLILPSCEVEFERSEIRSREWQKDNQ